MAQSGCRMRFRKIGPLTVSVTGVGSPRGAGRGSTTHHGDLRLFTMAAGLKSAHAGLGFLVNSPPAQFTPLRWLLSSAAATAT